MVQTTAFGLITGLVRFPWLSSSLHSSLIVDGPTSRLPLLGLVINGSSSSTHTFVQLWKRSSISCNRHSLMHILSLVWWIGEEWALPCNHYPPQGFMRGIWNEGLSTTSLPSSGTTLPSRVVSTSFGSCTTTGFLRWPFCIIGISLSRPHVPFVVLMRINITSSCDAPWPSGFGGLSDGSSCRTYSPTATSRPSMIYRRARHRQCDQPSSPRCYGIFGKLVMPLCSMACISLLRRWLAMWLLIFAFGLTGASPMLTPSS